MQGRSNASGGRLRVSFAGVRPFVAESEEIRGISRAAEVLADLVRRAEDGGEGLGWLRLPEETSEDLLAEIESTAEELCREVEAVVVVGIGGSYAGTRAVLEFLRPPFAAALPGCPEVYFAGHHLGSFYHASLRERLAGKRVALVVVSKSGTTLEPAVVFAWLEDALERAGALPQGPRSVVAITDPEAGVLREQANRRGYRTFAVPRDVGGRFSVLTPVGLVPLALAGISPRRLLAGAREGFVRYREPDAENPALRYGLLRYLLYLKGYVVEVLAVGDPTLEGFAEWWKQLFGESEGKDGRALYPASAVYTRDLHSLGQYLQDGRRHLLETLFVVEEEERLTLPFAPEDPHWGYLAGRTLRDVLEATLAGVVRAHTEGGIPLVELRLRERSPEALGEAFAFFEVAVAVSATLLGVNPFDQPGVEAYKRHTRRLLGGAE
ncbi:MAG: glucose-6-phosphate isomerase [Brockia lithotrophica]|nr:glucose-6-phosphate isomerase [Brockia lithotrophica]